MKVVKRASAARPAGYLPRSTWQLVDRSGLRPLGQPVSAADLAAARGLVQRAALMRERSEQQRHAASVVKPRLAAGTVGTNPLKSSLGGRERLPFSSRMARPLIDGAAADAEAAAALADDATATALQEADRQHARYLSSLAVLEKMPVWRLVTNLARIWACLDEPGRAPRSS